MLYAEIHGKLVPEAPELERVENVLTSTVWGTLFLAGAWDVVRLWIERARDVEDRPIDLGHTDGEACWFRFWPRLYEAEPDLLLRMGGDLVVVEAKYLSGMSGTGVDDAGVVRDQLARQWRSIEPERQRLAHYSADVREAIEQATSRSIVYLVRRRDAERARGATRASKELAPAARLYLSCWEDLHAVLLERARSGVRVSGWEADLRSLLERRGLRAFMGFRGLWKRDETPLKRKLPALRHLRPPLWTPRFVCCLARVSPSLVGRIGPRLRRGMAPVRLRTRLAAVDTQIVGRMWSGRTRWTKRS